MPRLVIEAIIKTWSKYIHLLPTGEEIQEATAAFEMKFGFPQVLGCVCGTYIPIIQPSSNSHDYFSYKMKYSLNFQC